MYRDNTGFCYDIKLLRLEFTKNTNERLLMRLYESHTTPHTYAVHIRFHTSKKKKVVPPSVAVLDVECDEGRVIANVGSDWATAMKVFDETFWKLTGLRWEERGDKKRAGMVRADFQAENGEYEKYFKYHQPKEGEPRGLFPPGMKLTAA